MCSVKTFLILICTHTDWYLWAFNAIFMWHVRLISSKFKQVPGCFDLIPVTGCTYVYLLIVWLIFSHVHTRGHTHKPSHIKDNLSKKNRIMIISYNQD